MRFVKRMERIPYHNEDRKTVKVFAWLPHCLKGTYTTVWLETYIQEWEYRVGPYQLNEWIKIAEY